LKRRPLGIGSFHSCIILDYAADIANKAQNIAIVEGQLDFAVPVDLDATWRGSPTTGSAFLKTLPMEIRIQKMERNYEHSK